MSLGFDNFNQESLDITLMRVMMTIDLMLARFLCGEAKLKVKYEPEEVYEKIIGTENCDFCA